MTRAVGVREEKIKRSAAVVRGRGRLGANPSGTDGAEALRGRVWVHLARVLPDGRMGAGGRVALL